MAQIFIDNFDNETVGQPPSNWDVSDPTKVTIQTDPAPEYPTDLAMRITASSGNEVVTAKRLFDPQTEVVEFNFKFYVEQITNPPLNNAYKFCEIAVYNSQEPPNRVLTLVLTYATNTAGNASKIALATAPNKMVVLGNWSLQTWHKIKLRFYYTGIFNWVEIFIDDQNIPYCFGQDCNLISQLSFAVRSLTIMGQIHSCTLYIDDVECTQQAYEVPYEYFCPTNKLSMVFPIAPVNITAVFYDGGIPPIPYNWQIGFEQTNVNHPHLGREWRSMLTNPRETSGSTVAEHILYCDLGSAQTVDAVGILNHNLADGLALLSEPPRDFFLIATNDISKPVSRWDYYFNLNILAFVGLYVREFFGESNVPLGLTNILVFPQKTYRYWGILIRQYAPIDEGGNLQKTNLKYFKIGRLVLGTLGESFYNFSDNLEIEVVDPSRVVDTVANARWARAISPYRKIKVNYNLNDIDSEDVAYFFSVMHKEPYIFIILPKRVNQELGKTSWVYARISQDSFGLNYVFKDYADFEIELVEEVW